MDTAVSLQSVLLLLASAVLAVAVSRSLRLPPIVGYLAAGIVLGPHAAGLLANRDELRHLADFGVVFLMFSIGLEFSLTRLMSMRRIVFGFGVAQVALTLIVAVGLSLGTGYAWQTGIAVGAVAAMSSTAIVSKLLAERGELDTAHGREVIGVLLFQDLAVVPFLVLLPALDRPGDALGAAVAIALGKAALVLAIVVFAGPRVMRAWLGVVARRRSTELFVLNVLLITLLLAWLTGLAGLSMVLGAFLAGMLISETEYRFQVEEDIKPFRDVLLGLFFITIGAMLDFGLIAERPQLVLMFLALVVGAKFALIAALSRAFGAAPGTALRVALALAQAGEFGFVLLPLAGGIVPDAILQPLLAAMVVSMIATPFIIAASDRIVMRLSRSEWMERSLQLHRVATQSMETERHVIILGYGRNGQRLARLLQAEQVPYVALDLDPDRVREAAAAGDRVVFADSSRREALLAAGLSRAAAVVVTYADIGTALRVLSHIRSLEATLPVIVRARDEGDIERLTAAGATEVVPEAFESGVMLASHTLVVVGVPLSRVMRRVSQVRDERYQLLRGLFHAPGEREDDEGAARLHAVTLHEGAYSIGKRVRDLGLDKLGVEVRAVRRFAARGNLSAEDAGPLQDGDVVVMLGRAEALNAAESRLLRF